jgi:hypothetical protein
MNHKGTKNTKKTAAGFSLAKADVRGEAIPMSKRAGRLAYDYSVLIRTFRNFTVPAPY